MKFIELFFAVIYYSFQKKGERDLLNFYACIVTALIFGFNIIIVLELIDSFLIEFKFLEGMNWVLIVSSGSLILTYLYFFSSGRAKKVIVKYKDLSKVQYAQVFGYMLITIILLIIMANLKRNDVI